MNADQELARVVRKTLWIRQEHLANAMRELRDDLRFLAEIDARLASCGVYPEFEAGLDSSAPTVLGIRIGE